MLPKTLRSSTPGTRRKLTPSLGLYLCDCCGVDLCGPPALEFRRTGCCQRYVRLCLKCCQPEIWRPWSFLHDCKEEKK